MKASAVAEMKTDLESLQLCAAERWGARKGFMRWSGRVAAKEEMQHGSAMSSRQAIPNPLLTEANPMRVRIPELAGKSSISREGLRRRAAIGRLCSGCGERQRKGGRQGWRAKKALKRTTPMSKR